MCVWSVRLAARRVFTYHPDGRAYTRNRICGGDGSVPNDTFKAGARWPDDRDVHINAHGGGILRHAKTYYWFGEHKITGPWGNTAQVGVHCYASEDLYNWRDMGIALCVSADRHSEIARGSIIERPKVLYNEQTGRFVMWFHLELFGQGYNAARTAVAVAKQAVGPYEFVRSCRPNAGEWPLHMGVEERKCALDALQAGRPVDESEGSRAAYVLARDLKAGQMARDMTLFQDDDGTAYHVHASEENLTLHIAELTPDYCDFSGRYVRAFPGASNEAPALFKRRGRYYMITSGCTGWKPNAARSAVADAILGPWTALENPCRGPGPADDAGAELTFGGQSTHAFPIADKPDAFIAMFDIWHPQNPIDGRYMWLPIEFTPNGAFEIRYRAQWSLDVFGKKAP